jgi:hypothetical protein
MKDPAARHLQFGRGGEMLFGMDDRMARRAWPALLLGLLQTATAVPAAEPELAALLARNTYAIRIEGREISGPGLAWIESQAAEAHFFLLGEQHATADIAHLSDGLFERLNALGYSVAAVEVGPWSASLMEAMLRRDGGEPFEHYLRDPSHRLVFPFFSFSEEADFARTVVRLASAGGPALWGLDQEFLGAGPLLLDELERAATTDGQRTAVLAARQSVVRDPMALGTGADDPWLGLESAFRGFGEAGALADAILVSRRIYAPFTGRGGHVYQANNERERYMKRNLTRHLAADPGRDWPKVFMKFGANHLAYGHSPTGVLSLGTFVHEIATMRDKSTFSLHVDCRGGEAMDVVTGHSGPCQSGMLESDSDLMRFVQASTPTLIDLRSLRPYRRLWRNWDEKSRTLIAAYDAYLVLPNVRPATLIVASSASASGQGLISGGSSVRGTQ